MSADEEVILPDKDHFSQTDRRADERGDPVRVNRTDMSDGVVLSVALLTDKQTMEIS